MQRLYERAKIDIGVVPQTLNNSNVSGAFYKGADFRRALGILQVGALAVTKTAKLELMEATDAAGAGAQLITGATATIAANVNVSELTIALDTVLNGESVTINGLEFSGHTNTTTAANREFSIAGDNTADAAALAGLINDADYGVPGVTATAATGTITLKATDPGKTLITATSSDATFTIATTKAQAYVEFDGLELSAGFSHIGCKITSTGNGGVGAVLLRGDERDVIAQKMAAAAAA